VGDYNRALEDYDRVADYSPDNVLVYFNRALLYTRLGEPHLAIDDYSRAIELYPDFAAAYINRSELKRQTGDVRGSKSDLHTAQQKIAQYRSRLWDTTSMASFADTSRRFNRLLSFDTKLSAKRLAERGGENNISLLPMFKFTMLSKAPERSIVGTYHTPTIDSLVRRLGGTPYIFSNRESDIAADTLVRMSRAEAVGDNYEELFRLGVAQSLVRQYTSSVGTFTTLIEQHPTDALLYINRSTVRAEMTDFISSISQGYSRITIDSDPAKKLHSGSTRTYDYDESIADLNKAAKLAPDLAYIYYNRGNLQAISGRLPEAFDDYTRAIELNPSFAEAYYNRGLVQIYMKDTRKGCLDISKAGELGIEQAYRVLNLYATPAHN
jgi:tetratricopeptide (TPR) repeat protein